MLSAGKKAKIFLVEDHPVVRECLRGCLSRELDLEICGESDQSKKALLAIPEAQPDLIILDISLQGGSGFELIKGIKAKFSRIKILVFSMHDEKLYAERCIRAGASGYVMKRESTGRLLGAIREVLDGKISVSEKMMASFAQKIVGTRKPSENLRQHNLSDRELVVLDLLGEGLSSHVIAKNLDINVKTVHAHCANIKQKLGLSTARELLREATKWHDGSSAFE